MTVVICSSTEDVMCDELVPVLGPILANTLVRLLGGDMPIPEGVETGSVLPVPPSDMSES